MYSVYRYVDLNDYKTKYIGITYEKKGNGLRRRCLDHFKNDVWSHGKFHVGYIQVATKTDAEFLEAFFIAEYRTDKYFNKAKANWGGSRFVKANQFRWQHFVDYDNNLTPKLIDKQSKFVIREGWKYSTWQGKNGAWYTYLPDPATKRKLVRRSNKEDIEQAIKDFREKLEIIRGLA